MVPQIRKPKRRCSVIDAYCEESPITATIRRNPWRTQASIRAASKGCGRLLLAALIDACVRQGFRLMVAVIGDSSQYASITLHRRLGFRICGTIHSVGYKHGRLA